MEIILASKSPRRVELLQQFNTNSAFRSLMFQKSRGTVLNKQQSAMPLRRRGLFRAVSQSLIIGADTIVVVDQEILGKPRDRGCAKMLRLLSGRKHHVITELPS